MHAHTLEFQNGFSFLMKKENPFCITSVKLYLRDSASRRLPKGSLGRLVGSNITVGALGPGDAALVRCRAGCIVGGIDGRAAS